MTSSTQNQVTANVSGQRQAGKQNSGRYDSEGWKSAYDHSFLDSTLLC